MNQKDNPFGAVGGQYTTSVKYGSGNGPATPAPEAPGDGLIGGGAAAADLVKDTTTQGFTADVMQESSNQPVLVDFWAPWCGPCKQLTPVLEKAVRQAGGRVKLVKMNIDDHPTIPGQLGVQSIPAVIAFKDGKPVDAFMGAVPESQVKAFIDRIAGPGGGNEIEQALAAARDALEAGDKDMAAQIFQAIRQQEPDNADAIAGLADLMFEAGDADGAAALLSEVDDKDKDHAAVAAVRAKITLAEQTAGLGDRRELEQRLAADAADHQARFDLALILNALDQRDEAAEHLLAIIKADRGWQDDAARNQLLQFFEAWGATDESTLSARRKLSSLLFS